MTAPHTAESVTVELLTPEAAARDAEGLAHALAAVLVDCVAGGASVSFMSPLTPERAAAFWRGVLASHGRGERLLLVARAPDGTLCGTVQVVLDLPENQPHRGDLAKMLVHSRMRRRGVARALLGAAEAAALAAGRTLLVLDTVTGGDAERLYLRAGWTLAGRIPGYALFPDGRPCGTTLFYKPLAADHCKLIQSCPPPSTSSPPALAPPPPGPS